MAIKPPYIPRYALSSGNDDDLNIYCAAQGKGPRSTFYHYHTATNVNRKNAQKDDLDIFFTIIFELNQVYAGQN